LGGGDKYDRHRMLLKNEAESAGPALYQPALPARRLNHPR
jgi:hypothetical protein